MAVIMYTFPLEDLGCGPVTSTPILFHGDPTVMDFSTPDRGGFPRKNWAQSLHCTHINWMLADHPDQ